MKLPDVQDVIDQTSAIDDLGVMGDYFLRLFEDIGFDGASFHLLRTSFTSTARGEIPLINNYSSEVVERYITKLHVHDPVLMQIGRERTPFHWHDIGNKRALTKPNYTYADQMRELGLSDGLAIPLFGPMGETAAVGLSIRQGKLDLSTTDILYLHHLTYRVYSRLQSLREKGQTVEAPPDLSPREAEIMKWVAAGKSNSVIGDILNISEHTVDSLLRRVFRKLGVSNRIAAVLTAAENGQIPYAEPVA